MSDPKTCPRCGATLATGDELCPRCLLELGRSGAEPESPDASGSARRPKRRAAPALEEIARRFPDLEVVSLIGEGGMGAVYKARQARIDRWVALKVLALDPGDDPTFAERFRREAMALARLDHPNIVKLYDFGERDGLFFLVLELVDGTNLRTLMKQALLAPKQALAIVPQMCEALQFAHDEGIVHRDIKPENVLIDTKGRVKIADFGLAKLLDADARDVSLTEVGQVMGTPHYMAPEQLRGAHDVDHRADIYSLGVVFYEMLTGDLPRGNFELPSKRVQVDVKLDEIVLKSLERTPERRYQHAVEVKTDVESVGSGSGRSHLRSRRDSIHERATKSAFDSRAERHARQLEIRGVHVGVIYPNRPWHYFFAFFFLWPLVGLAFNGGGWWFTAAMVLVASTFWSLVERLVGSRPELASALEAESHLARSARALAATVLLAFGCFALFAGHVSLFGDLARDDRSGPSDPSAMHRLETELLPMLQSRLHLEWPVPTKDIAFRPGWILRIDQERIWSSGFLVLLAPLLIAAAACALSLKRTQPSSGFHWRTTVFSTASMLGSLLLLEGSCALLGAVRNEHGPLVPALERGLVPDSTTEFAYGIEDLAQRLRIALIRQDYVVTANGVWSFREPGAPTAETKQLQILFADPSSPFARWHISWTGPKRIQPHAVFVLRGRPDAGAATLECDLGDVRPESAERREWPDWLEKTLATIPYPLQ